MAAAEGGKPCAAPSALTRAGFALPRLARSLEKKEPTTILVVNSASTAKRAGTDEAGKDSAAKDSATKDSAGKTVARRSFPSYIEETLRARYPEGGIVVATRSAPRATAEAMLDDLPEMLAETKPALMIWQTGTFDAILGAETSAFSDAVGSGIRLAHAAGADVVLISPQYSPRTALAFDIGPYTNALRWTARLEGVPFFDRYAIMRFWEDDGIFDLDASRPSPTLFDEVHRCIGRLLVGLIVDGVDLRTLGSR
ncbi:SGNH/GDSL hydrolase family protein [Ancylobacter sp. IITR112]|uniref:SGNH/GDSL hydrolase family protein n=1 Tax=Ancylobacter sp. IITR112 TaxID=3138073 RepID=UPI00352B74C9